MLYEIVRTTEPDRPPWRVSARGYAYEMQTARGELVWSCHWHPTAGAHWHGDHPTITRPGPHGCPCWQCVGYVHQSGRHISPIGSVEHRSDI
jgi:hypothetical protein